jgi:hypothetical protein
MTPPLCVSMETVLRSLQALRPPDLFIKLNNKVMVRVVPDLEAMLRSSMAQRPDLVTQTLSVSMETELRSLQAQRPPDLFITVLSLGAKGAATAAIITIKLNSKVSV